MLEKLFSYNCMPKEENEEPPKKTRKVGGKKANLQCKEDIDWDTLQAQEPVPGALRTAAQANPFAPPFRLPEYAHLEIDSRDVKAINELGNMSLTKMDNYIRRLLGDAYVVEFQEAHEYKLARMLNIFPKSP